jgi:hypothetical protein
MEDVSILASHNNIFIVRSSRTPSFFDVYEAMFVLTSLYLFVEALYFVGYMGFFVTHACMAIMMASTLGAFQFIFI